MMSKKSNYRTVAEAIVFNKLGSLNTGTPLVDNRKLTVEEIKTMIKEELKDAQGKKVKQAKEVDKGWGAADVENQVKWTDALKLKEFFNGE